MKMTGAELIIRLLERQGITTVAGIPGGAILPIYDALGASAQIRHVLSRHEQGAGFIAQGMARASGQAAVCLASSGPGATNLITAIADARLDSIPIVCITGQVPGAMIGTDAFQEVDTYGLSVPVTKHNFLIASVGELLDVLPRAFRIALSGRPGPVLIDVPKDIQNATIAFDAWPEPGRAEPAPQPADSALAAALALIAQARRPILYLGGGVVHAGAAPLAREFAEAARLPTVMTLMALGTLPETHALHLGMLGMHGARCTNLALAECDLLIAVGARFDDRATGKVAGFCPNAAIVHIDIDASELDKIRTAHVALNGDVREVLARLLPQFGADAGTDAAAGRGDWLARIAELKRDFPLKLDGRHNPRHPYGLIRATARAAGPAAIVTTDVGQHQMWAAQAYPLERPRQWLTSGGLGTMGFGLPAAIGAALAEPQRPVVCFSGDGSILMNIQELATLAEERLDVKIVLFNNGALGLVHQQQTLFYGGRLNASVFRSQPDFVRLAQAFGIRSVDLDAEPDVHDALAAAFAERGPCLIHATIGLEEKVFPMVPPGAANTDMIGG